MKNILNNDIIDLIIIKKLKKKINKLNLKIHLCYNCNNILQKTEKLNSNCNFDSKCAKKSFFYCKKCKIHFFNYCIVSQKYLIYIHKTTLYSPILLSHTSQS